MTDWKMWLTAGRQTDKFTRMRIRQETKGAKRMKLGRRSPTFLDERKLLIV
jgi:hypothetical protein